MAQLRVLLHADLHFAIQFNNKPTTALAASIMTQAKQRTIQTPAAHCSIRRAVSCSLHTRESKIVKK
eukprot:7610-Heterococcus_DN1.PRE.1